MNDLIAVRVACATDATAIEHLYRQLVNDPSIRVEGRRLDDLANGTTTRVFVAESHVSGVATIVGTVLISSCSDIMYGDQPFAVVENIVVDNAYRSQGVGVALMRAAEQFAFDARCTKVMLLSAASRVEAHRFFASVGFRAEAKRGFVKYRSDYAAEHKARAMVASKSPVIQPVLGSEPE